MHGSVELSSGFAAEGEVRLLGAHIRGQLVLTGASLRNPDGRALDCERVRVQGPLFLHNLPHRPEGAVVLRGMRVGVLWDAPAGWAERMRLEGLVYDQIRMISVEERLDWLARDEGSFFPQPYEQLAAVYRRTGHDEDARRVAVAKQDARLPTLSGRSRWWRRFLRVTVGYGYRPWRTLPWLVALVALGAALALAAYRLGAGAWLDAQRPLLAFPLWALDVVVRLVDLYQQRFWIPTSDHWVGVLALVWYWLAIPAGWALTAVAAAALTGILKKD